MSSLAWRILAVQAASGSATNLFMWGDNAYGQIGSSSPQYYSWSQIAAGGTHTVAVRSDGLLFAWGSNSLGQLGDNTTIDRSSPVQIASTISWIAVSAGNYHTVAIANDYTLWGWGLNNYGQLADSTLTNRSYPIQISGNKSWTSVNAGGYHNVALKSDGSLWTWGADNAGQLGARISYVQLVSGDNHIVALKSDGSLWTWGINASGQLGDGTTVNKTSPVQVFSGTSWSQIAAGQSTSHAIRSDGSLWSWGANTNGQLGDGTSIARSSPVQIGTSSYSQVAASVGDTASQLPATYMIDISGRLFATGIGTAGAVGDGTTVSRSSPVQIGTGYQKVFGRYGGGYAIKSSNSSLWGWGYNQTYGSLGDGTTINRSQPVQIGNLSWSMVSGSYAVYGITSTGLLFAWGRDDYGDFGLNIGGTYRSNPTQIGFSSWTQVDSKFNSGANGFYTIAVDANNNLFTWGYNANGQLGLGNTTTHYSSPVQVGNFGAPASKGVAITTFSTYYLNSVGQLYTIGSFNAPDSRSSPVQVATFNPNFQAVLGQVGSSSYTYICAGKFNTLAITTQNKLFGWGLNPYGQVGDSTTIQRSSPVQIGNSSWTGVSSGGSHTLAIRSDGGLFTWGLNNYGQLGINSVATDLNWIALRDGGNHVLAIRSDGALFTWGSNNEGQLGDGTTINRSSPVQIGFSSWTSVTGGASHTVAIRSDGTLWAWGFNMNGQLGIGSGTGPTPYVGWSCVSVSEHVMAIRNDGTLWGWGYNAFVQLGTSSAVDRSNPVQVGVSGPTSGDYGLLKWKSVITGFGYTLGITEDGRCYGWGLNTSGQLGTNDVVSKQIPTPITNSGLFTKLYAGSVQFSAAIDVNNKLWAWGTNGNGQLGDGTLNGRSSPVQIGNSSWSMASLGNTTAFAISANGSLFGWGLNSSGQIGDNTTVDKSSPVQIGTSSWTYISAGTNIAGAIRTDSTLWVWGSNSQGQLGQNDTISRSSPVQIAGSWTSVRSYWQGFLAVDIYGYLYSWGSNINGEGGDATGLGYRSSPVQISSGSGWNLDKIININATSTQPNAGFKDGNLYMWGANGNGQLGFGDTLNRSSPVQVPAYSSVSSPVQVSTSSWISVNAGTYHTLAVSSDRYLYGWGTQLTPMYIAFPGFLNTYWSKISIGESHVLAIKNDGTLYAWGRNASGQLGDTTQTDKSSPVQVGIGRSWSQVAAGNSHSLAITSDGKLFSWGASDNGQLSGLSWTRIASGLSHTIALRSDYTVWGWGNNQLGQVGDNTTVNKSSPVQIAATGQGLAFSFINVSAGSTHSLALRVDGTLYAWGDNSSGQLGDGTYITRSSPTQISAGVSPSSATISAVFNQYPLTNSITQNNFSLAESGATGSTFDFNTTSKTFECFFYVTDFNFPQPIFAFGDWNNNVLSWAIVITRSAVQTYYNNASLGPATLALQASFITNNFSANLNVNTWYHLALVRNTTLLHAYINGVWLASGGWTNYVTSGTVAFNKTWIGSYFGHPRVNFRGLINNVRFTNSIVYAASANFTSPTGPLQLTQSANPYGGANTAAITAGQVLLLTLQTNPAVDSASGRTVTGTGSPRYTGAPSPFTTYLAGTSETIIKYSKIFAGSSHSVAISSPFGRLYAWGNNSNGQLGDGTTINRSTPTQIGADTNWNLVSAGGKPDTTIQAYSVSFNGSSSWYTGTGIPTAMSNTYTFEAWVYYTGGAARAVIAGNSGTASTNNFAVSINASRQVEYGLLNLGGAGGTTSTVTVNSISASTWTHIAVSVNAGAISIFINGISQTLTGTTTLTAITVQTVLVIGANTASANSNYWNGYIHALRIIFGQAMYSASFTPATIPYNYNQVGHTGAGAPASITGTVQYAGLGIGQYDYSGIILPYYYNDTFNTYYGNSSTRWELNEVGNAAYFTTGTPALITVNPYNISGSTTGDGFTTAINSTTKLLTWGYNNVGQLGDNTTVSRSSPVQLGTSNWSVVASNYYSSYGIATDGKLFVWGDNTSYQLGDNTTVSKSSPVQIGTSLSWSTIAASAYHALAITTTNNLYGWGANFYNQLGIINSFVTLASSAALRTDGTVWAWGNNMSGYLPTSTISSPVQIASGSYTFLTTDLNKTVFAAIKSDNTLWMWGVNTYGQLGNNTIVTTYSPVQITGSYSTVSVCDTFTLAIKTDGTLYAWGRNASGQLGDTTQTDRSSPVQIGTTSWTKISAGSSHSLAISSTNLLYGWGSNLNGQINNSGMSFLSIGSSVVVRQDNQLWIWGSNQNGQVGDGTTVSRSSPVQVAGLWKYVLNGEQLGVYNVSKGVKIDGTLYAWGLGTYGGLADNSTANRRSSPVQIGTDIDWNKVWGHGDTHFATKQNGTLYGWGDNSTGQIGDSTTASRSSPVQIAGSWTIIASNNGNTLGIRTDGTLWAWGNNNVGQIGDNTTVNKSSPVQVAGSWLSVSTLQNTVLAINSTYKLFAWGDNTAGKLGDGTVVNKSSPVQIGVGSWIACATGYVGSAAILSDGKLFTWGSAGSMGDGVLTSRSSPVQLGTSSWSMVASGYFAAHGVTLDNRYFTWMNTNGPQQGNNSISGANSPVLTVASQTNLSTTLAPYFLSPILIGASSWSFVSAGLNFSAAIKADSTLWMWGSNTGGQQGQGDSTARSSPVQLGTSSYTSVSAGSSMVAAIKLDGSVITCGLNTFGQLGDTTTTNRNSPVAISVAAGTSFTSITSGNNNLFARTIGTGLVYAWGDNSSGQLGDGTIINRSSPVLVSNYIAPSIITNLTLPNLSSWTTVNTGTNSSYGYDIYYNFNTWGLNTTGQLGDGTTINKNSPTQTSTGSSTVLRLSPLQVGTSSWSIVSAGASASAAITTDKTLFLWGLNSSGQIGDNTTVTRSIPIQTNGSWNLVSMKTDFVIATKNDGTLWGWGNGTFGVLANNLETNISYRSSPIQIGTSSWTQISAGSSHVMGLINNSLYLWGNNTFGQLANITSSDSWQQVTIGTTTFGLKNGGYLYAWGAITGGSLVTYGDNTTVAKSSPVQVSTMSFNFIATMGGETGSSINMFAVDFSGVLYGWGLNTNGQIGDGTTIYRSSPVQVGTALNWTKIYITNGTTIGLTGNGGLYAWGLNTTGQLGDNTTISRSSPVQIFSGGVSSVCQGLSYVAIVKTDGTLWSWGSNTDGRLGSGTTVNRSSPVQVGTLNTWTKVVSTANGVVALQSNNSLWSWGSNAFGQIGDLTTASRSSPVQIAGNWTDVTAFATTVLATSDSVVYGWGYNQNGNLGDNTTLNKSSPVLVAATFKQLPNSNLVSGIQTQTGYVNSVGILFTLGTNSSGQLGDNTVVGRSSPVQIGTRLRTIIPSPVQLNSSSYSQISAGYSFSSALGTNGTLWAWGDNTFGQLGQSDTISRSSPVQVGSFSYTNLYAGSYNIFGVFNDTTIQVGLNNLGQLGQFDTTSRSSPVQMGTGKGSLYDRPTRIGLLSSWAFVSASMSTSMAIDALGRLYMWGANGQGQLGDITLSNRSSPLQIGTNSWITGSVSDNFTTAIRIDNTLWAWGFGQNGELGDSTTVNKSSPVQVTGNWTDVQAGKSYVVALAQNGTVWTWGANSFGGLNNSSLFPRSSPVQVGTKIYKYIATTNNSSNAIDSYGNLFTWGDNTFGQIGNNT